MVIQRDDLLAYISALRMILEEGQTISAHRFPLTTDDADTSYKFPSNMCTHTCSCTCLSPVILVHNSILYTRSNYERNMHSDVGFYYCGCQIWTSSAVSITLSSCQDNKVDFMIHTIRVDKRFN